MVAALVLTVSLTIIPEDACGLAEFNRRVSDYTQLTSQAAAAVPPERVFDDPTEMLEARASLRKALRAARPNARPGDVVGGCAGHMLRQIIAAALARPGVDPVELKRQFAADRPPGAKRPVVNHRYDWRLGAWMWPALLRDLPPLPGDLEYRIVDDDLVLVDVRASFVVDILEDVLGNGEE